MRKVIQPGSYVLLLATMLLALASCSKEMSATNGTNHTANTSTTSTSPTIAVASDSTGVDSVYILQTCDNGFFRDSIGASGLPDSVLNYLATNYPGYSFQRAFQIKDSAGAAGGYVVIISFNGKPVGLLFDASGHLQRVLEQRERGDMEGEGWHPGGRFADRDGTHRDSISLTALPQAILSYMSSNDPTDTLVRAFRNYDSSILVISSNNGLFVNLFNAAGVFVRRVALTPPLSAFNMPLIQNIAQDSLPAAGLTYLATTFPNYVFETAVSLTVNGQLLGYGVLIDANNTKYMVWFDASGNMILTLPVW